MTRQLQPGHVVKLAVHLPDRLALHLKAALTHVIEGVANSPNLCGVRFLDYDSQAWAALSKLHSAAYACRTKAAGSTCSPGGVPAPAPVTMAGMV